MSRETVIDATNLVLGRMASIVAKRLLNGERIVIVNAEKAVISGEPRMVIESYKILFNVGTLRNPYRHGIRRPRTPERIVRLAIRGMLPMEKRRGRDAYRRLRVYCGIPPEYRNRPLQSIKEASALKLSRTYVKVGDVALQMGWKPKVVWK